MNARRDSHSTPQFRLWDGLGTVLLNALAWLVVILYLFPIAYMVVTAVKTPDQFTDANAPLWPAKQVTFAYGDDGKTYGVYQVPIDGQIRQLALVERRRTFSNFVDPQNPGGGLIRWEGYWGKLEPVYRFDYTLEAFAGIWNDGAFLKPVVNTLLITVVAGSGVLVSSILVAYGFARYPVPGGRWLFIMLLASIMLPDKVTVIPTYFMYVKVLNWIGTWLPLIVPHFFGNAIMIFLLRQNFKSIPKEMEEAAILDGAGPLRLLISIILPQATPTVLTVALLQFFFFWNETRTAALYVSVNREISPVSFWLQTYSNFFPTFNQLQASALMVMIVPVVVLLLTQRVFMQGVVVTDSEK